MNMFLQDHKSLMFTRIGIFSSDLMPAYSAMLYVLFYTMYEQFILFIIWGDIDFHFKKQLRFKKPLWALPIYMAKIKEKQYTICVEVTMVSCV